MNFDCRAKKFSETKTAVRLNLLQIFEPVRYNVYFYVLLNTQFPSSKNSHLTFKTRLREKPFF